MTVFYLLAVDLPSWVLGIDDRSLSCCVQFLNFQKRVNSCGPRRGADTMAGGSFLPTPYRLRRVDQVPGQLSAISRGPGGRLRRSVRGAP